MAQQRRPTLSVPEILTASIPEILAGRRPGQGPGRRLPLRAKRDARSGGRDARDDEAVRDPGPAAGRALAGRGSSADGRVRAHRPDGGPGGRGHRGRGWARATPARDRPALQGRGVPGARDAAALGRARDDVARGAAPGPARGLPGRQDGALRPRGGAPPGARPPAGPLRGPAGGVQPARLRRGRRALPGWEPAAGPLLRLEAQVLALRAGLARARSAGGVLGPDPGRALRGDGRGAAALGLRSPEDRGDRLGEGRHGHAVERDLRPRDARASAWASRSAGPGEATRRERSRIWSGG